MSQKPALATAAPQPPVRTEEDGNVLVIRLNRPHAMNAVNADLAQALGEALEMLDREDKFAVGVLTGEGKAFCAGKDLKEHAAGRSTAPKKNPEWGFAGIVRHFVRKPLIAAVNGFALGGGTEIVMASDIAIAAEHVKLGLPEVTRGLIAAGGGLFRAPEQAGIKFAMKLALTGEPISATEAMNAGLLNEVVSADELMHAAMRLARKIGNNGPLAVQTSKRIMYQSLRYGSAFDSQIWADTEEDLSTVQSSEDSIIGAKAFANNEVPQWVGH